MSTGLDAISETAFNDFCCWAIQQSNIRQRFTLETGHDVEALIRASIIEKMIDNASGRTNAVAAAWIDWVRTNLWGDSSTPTPPPPPHKPPPPMTDPTPQSLPLDRPRYLQETPNGWEGADHLDGPWRPVPGPQTQPPFPVGEGPSERIVSIAKAVQECAFAHEPDARLIGNVCAEDVADLCDAVLARWGRPAAPPAPRVGAEALVARTVAAVEICHGQKDGECHWEQCPQLRDSEPAATGRGCPLPLDPDDIERAVLAARPAAPPAPEPPAEALAARPLLETPNGWEGADHEDWFAVALIAQDMRSRGMAEQACGDELLRLANSNRSQPAAARAALKAEPAGEGPSHGEVCQWLEQQAHWGDNAHLTPRIANMVQDALARWGRPITPPAPEPPPADRYEFKITDRHGQTVASGDAATLEDARRRLSQIPRGPFTLRLRRVEVLSVSAPEPQPAPAPAPAPPPLWQLMLHAYDNAPAPSRGAPDDWTDRQGYAAEILAVRDRLFPGGRPDPAGVSHDCLSIWTELTTEAARAEAGE